MYLRPAGLKRFLTAWQQRLQTSVTHPQVGEPIFYVRAIEVQVWDYVACLVGERSLYCPFRQKA